MKPYETGSVRNVVPPTSLPLRRDAQRNAERVRADTSMTERCGEAEGEGRGERERERARERESERAGERWSDRDRDRERYLWRKRDGHATKIFIATLAYARMPHCRDEHHGQNLAARRTLHCIVDYIIL